MKQTCVEYRHRPFKVNGICTICNPSSKLGEILQQNPQLESFYMANLVGRHCHKRDCWSAGVADDGIGHWWCKNHEAQCQFLRLGAERDFPTVAQHRLRPGRAAWYNLAQIAKAEQLDQICVELAAAESVVVR